jgi:hypothetical protein
MTTRSLLYRSLLPGFTLLLLATACATPRARGHDPFAQPTAQPTSEEVQVFVENRNWEATTIYIARAGTLMRLGIVEGLASRTFRLRSAWLAGASDISFVAETHISRDRYTLPGVPAAAGHNLHAVVGSTLSLSFVRWF